MDWRSIALPFVLSVTALLVLFLGCDREAEMRAGGGSTRPATTRSSTVPATTQAAVGGIDLSLVSRMIRPPKEIAQDIARDIAVHGKDAVKETAADVASEVRAAATRPTRPASDSSLDVLFDD